MTSESGAMSPLAVPQKTPWVRSPQSRMDVVEATWSKLEERMEGEDGTVISARAAFVAGVYACAAAVLNERAHSRELSEAAMRIERG
jgi:hypothetical protein